MRRNTLRRLGLLVAGCCLLFGMAAAQTVPAAKPTLEFIPAEKLLAGVIVRPADVLKNPEIQKLYQLANTLPGGTPEQELGVKLTDVESLVFGFNAYHVPNQKNSAGVTTTMIRVNDPAKLSILAGKAIQPGAQKRALPGVTQDVMVAPQPRWNFRSDADKAGQKMPVGAGNEPPPPAAADPDEWKICDATTLVDDRTLVFSQQAQVLAQTLDQTKAGAAPPAWAAKYAGASKFPVSAVVDLKQVRNLVNAEIGAERPQGMPGMVFATVSQIWEKADHAVVALDTADGLKLTVVTYSADDASAKAVKGTLDGLLGLAKGFLPQLKQEAAQLDQFQPGLGGKLAADLETAVNDLSVTQSGSMIVLKFAIKQQTLTTAVGAIGPALEKSAALAKQNMGINNLKMIALAMHNHHDTYRGFPTSALLRGDSKYPMSWRVAILPFIEEDVLYREYKIDEPWDSEANKKVLAKMPAVYRARRGARIRRTPAMCCRSSKEECSRPSRPKKVRPCKRLRTAAAIRS
ncbi:MAG: DUF1559 domain-containing protein [Pirellulales bacterium]